MIYDSLANSGMYNFSGYMAKALEFLKKFDPKTADGKYEIDGTNVYAMVMSYNTRAASEVKFEAHRKYIDIQFLCSGSERIDVALLGNGLEINKPFDESTDAALYEEPKSYSSIAIKPLEFAVFYPQDVHRPCVSLNGETPIRKIVVKIKVA